MSNDVSCPNCRARVAEGDAFCGSCGYAWSQTHGELPRSSKAQESPCWNCGTAVPVDAQYCRSCGLNLDEWLEQHDWPAFWEAAREIVGPRKVYSKTPLTRQDSLRIEEGVVTVEGLFGHRIPTNEIDEVRRRRGGVIFVTFDGDEYSVGTGKAEEFIRDIRASGDIAGQMLLSHTERGLEDDAANWWANYFLISLMILFLLVVPVGLGLYYLLAKLPPP